MWFLKNAFAPMILLCHSGRNLMSCLMSRKNRFPNDLWLCDKWNIGNLTFLQFKHQQLKKKPKMVSIESPHALTINAKLLFKYFITFFHRAEHQYFHLQVCNEVLNTKGVHHISPDAWTRNHGAPQKKEWIKIPSYQPSKRAVLGIIDPRSYEYVQMIKGQYIPQ